MLRGTPVAPHTKSMARRRPRRWRRAVVAGALVALCSTLARNARADGEESAASDQAVPLTQVAALPPAGPPGLDLEGPRSAAPEPSLVSRWWFWTALGVVAATTAVVMVASIRGQAPPATQLGNQEFRP